MATTPQDCRYGDSYYATTLSQASMHARQHVPAWLAWLDELDSNGHLQHYSPSRIPACAFHVHVKTASCSRTLEGWNMPGNCEDEQQYIHGRCRLSSEVSANKATTWLAEMRTRKTLRESLSVPTLLFTEHTDEQASSSHESCSSRSISPLLPSPASRYSPLLTRMRSHLALQNMRQISLSPAAHSVDLDISDSSSLPIMPTDLTQLSRYFRTPSP